eukprot:581644-Rhodomonas_salina.1
MFYTPGLCSPPLPPRSHAPLPAAERAADALATKHACCAERGAGRVCWGGEVAVRGCRVAAALR